VGEYNVNATVTLEADCANAGWAIAAAVPQISRKTNAEQRTLSVEGPIRFTAVDI